MDRLTTQTLQGMSLNALKNHYKKVYDDFQKTSSRDSRTMSYLLTVDSYIQLKQQEETN